MIEEILKSINSNLERIANSIETQLNTKSKLQMSGEKIVAEVAPISQVPTDITAQQVVSNTIKNTGASTVNVAPMQAESVQNYVQPSQVIPTSPMQQSFTMEQLAVSMSNAVSTGKMDVIQRILQQLGVQALTQVKPEDYNKVATMLKEAGVQI